MSLNTTLGLLFDRVRPTGGLAIGCQLSAVAVLHTCWQESTANA